jgi:hypothetical protein
VAEVIDHLPRKPEALNSNPSVAKTKQNKKKRKRMKIFPEKQN